MGGEGGLLPAVLLFEGERIDAEAVGGGESFCSGSRGEGVPEVCGFV